MKKYNIVVTGGEGRFASVFKNEKVNFKVIYPTKKELNILNINSIQSFIRKTKPKYLIHLAGFSRPMKLHDKEILKSINLNIIGTSNVTKVCIKFNVKLIYFSTNFVYPGKKGNYKETDPVLPFNNYAWSKLGGECAVQMYKNSLILRVSMTEYPFIHKKAFCDVKNNFLFHKEVAKILPKVLNKKGVINIGGKTNTVYNFAKKYNKKIKKIYSRGEFPKRMDMNLSKIKNL